MLLQVIGVRYLVGFEHHYYTVDDEIGLGTDERRPYGTTCFIKQFCSGDKEPLLVAQGEAFCHVNDQFCKETGRKLAMTRALQELFPNDKYARGVFWTLYRQARISKPKEPNGNTIEVEENESNRETAKN